MVSGHIFDTRRRQNDAGERLRMVQLEPVCQKLVHTEWAGQRGKDAGDASCAPAAVLCYRVRSARLSPRISLSLLYLLSLQAPRPCLSQLFRNSRLRYTYLPAPSYILQPPPVSAADTNSVFARTGVTGRKLWLLVRLLCAIFLLPL